MSGILTILPDAVLEDNGGWTNTGGAGSKWQAVSDALDTTYLAANASNGNIQFSFATASLPARCIISKITLKVRAFQTSGKQSMRVQFSSGADFGFVPTQVGYPVPKSSIQDFEVVAYGYYAQSESRQQYGPDGIPTGTSTWTAQQVIDNLQARLYATDTDLRVYKLWIEVEYDEPPVVSSIVLSPASANLYTLNPTIAWTYLDPEASPQYEYDLEIWKQSDTLVTGYAPFQWIAGQGIGHVGSNDMEIAGRGFRFGGVDYYPAYVASSDGGVTAGVISPSQQHQVATALQNGENYIVNLRVRDQVYTNDRWSATISSGAITMQAVTPPSPPKPVSTLQNSSYRVKLDILGAANPLTDNQADMETDASGWEADALAPTIAADAVTAALIGSDTVKVTSTAAGNMKARTKRVPVAGTLVSVAPSTAHVAMIHVRRAGATNRNVRCDIIWWDEDGNEISRKNGEDRPSTQSVYVPYATWGTSPSNAAAASVVMTVLSVGAAGEIFNIDKASISPVNANSVNLLINGSFEAGATTYDYWSNFTAGTFAGVTRSYLANDTNFPGHGSRAGRMVASNLGATTADIVAFQANTPGYIQPATAYVLTADVRADVAPTGARWYMALEYFTSAGASAGSSTFNTPAITTGVTTTISVSGTTPASTAYINVKIGMQGRGAGSAGAIDFRIDEVQLEAGSTFTNYSEIQWVRGGSLSSQQVEVQRTYDGGVTWYPIPGSPFLMDSTYNQKRTVYDTVISPGKQAVYRSRMSYTDPFTGGLVTSPWSAVTAGVSVLSSKFVLRDPTDPDLFVEFQVASLAETSDEDLGELWPVGSEEPIHISSAVHKGTFNVEAVVTAAQLVTLEALRKRKSAMVFITDMDGVWYWVRFGQTVNKDWLYSTARKNPATRKHTLQFQLAQTKPAVGQPLVMV